METDNLLTGSMNRAYGSGSDSESGGGPSSRRPSHLIAEESNRVERGTGEWMNILTLRCLVGVIIRQMHKDTWLFRRNDGNEYVH